MLVASRQNIWSGDGHGTVIDVEMTPDTGLYIEFWCNPSDTRPVAVSWGDGAKEEHTAQASGTMKLGHSYALHGRYRVVFEAARSIGFRDLDGQAQHSYDAAILSFVDRSGEITQSRSGAFKRAVNLERFIAPNCQWMGQRDFAYCSRLREVVLGKNGICYDGTFQHCTSLEKYTTESTGTCWSYVWEGCTSLRELRLGPVSQFATRDFASCPNLMDIWISDKTVDQILQRAASGNIVAGYGARFPWDASPGCRFHGTDGVVLANGTRI